MINSTITTHAILDILQGYCLGPPAGTPNRSSEGRTKFVPIIQQKVETEAPIHLILPGFPFKSPNSKEKVLGILPDKAEEFALAHLDSLCKRIADVYKPGAELTIISDGLVYNDLLGVPDRNVWAYGQAVRRISQDKNFKSLKFARLHTMVDTEIDEDSLTEEVYLTNAASFRKKLESVISTTEVIEHLASNEDARTTYNGYSKVLIDDLAYCDKRNEEITAKKMILRGKAFAAAIENTYPDSVRLSIHPSSGNNKFSIRLFPTRKPTMTPWHTTIAFGIDGSFRTAHRKIMEASPSYELVERNQKPWFFREKSDLYSWGLDIEFEPSYPMGLVITPTPGTVVPSFTDIDIIKLRQLAEYNSPIVLRGFRDTSNKEQFTTWAEDPNMLCLSAKHPDITSGNEKASSPRFRIFMNSQPPNLNSVDCYTSSRAFFDLHLAPYTVELLSIRKAHDRYSREHIPKEIEITDESQEYNNLYNVIEDLFIDRRVGVYYEQQVGDIIVIDIINELEG